MTFSIAKNGITSLLLGAAFVSALSFPAPIHAADAPAGGGNALESGCGPDSGSYADMVAGHEAPPKILPTDSPEVREQKLREQYRAVNKQKGDSSNGYLASATGRYQINAPTLADIGLIKKDKIGSIPMGPGEWPADVWTDEARALGISSRETFKNNPAAQDSALSMLTEQKLGRINSSVWSMGSTPNGVPINSGSVASAAHMMGEGAFNNWAASGFTAGGLPPNLASDHDWTPEQANQHLLNRMATGACMDPSNIPISEMETFELPPIYLMEWVASSMVPSILPGQIPAIGTHAQ